MDTQLSFLMSKQEIIQMKYSSLFIAVDAECNAVGCHAYESFSDWLEKYVGIDILRVEFYFNSYIIYQSYLILYAKFNIDVALGRWESRVPRFLISKSFERIILDILIDLERINKNWIIDQKLTFYRPNHKSPYFLIKVCLAKS